MKKIFWILGILMLIPLANATNLNLNSALWFMKDLYVHEPDPNNNCNDGTFCLAVPDRVFMYINSNGVSRIYFAFNMSNMTQSVKDVKNISFSFEMVSINALPTRFYKVYYVNQTNWSETSMTWNNQICGTSYNDFSLCSASFVGNFTPINVPAGTIRISINSSNSMRNEIINDDGLFTLMMVWSIEATDDTGEIEIDSATPNNNGIIYLSYANTTSPIITSTSINDIVQISTRCTDETGLSSLYLADNSTGTFINISSTTTLTGTSVNYTLNKTVTASPPRVVGNRFQCFDTSQESALSEISIYSINAGCFYICSQRTTTCNSNNVKSICTSATEVNGCGTPYSGDFSEFGSTGCFGIQTTLSETGNGIGVMVDALRTPVGQFILFLSIIGAVVALILGIVYAVKNSITKNL